MTRKVALLIPMVGDAADFPVLEGPITVAAVEGSPVVHLGGFLEDPETGERVEVRIPIYRADAPALAEALRLVGGERDGEPAPDAPYPYDDFDQDG